jgi:hypothetical protein
MILGYPEENESLALLELEIVNESEYLGRILVKITASGWN